MSAPSMHIDGLFSYKAPHINQNYSVSHPGQENHDVVGSETSVWFAIDLAYYKIPNSPSPVGFPLVLSKSLQNTKTGIAQGTHKV